MVIGTIITASAAFPLKLILEFLFPLTPLDPDLSREIITVILFVILFVIFYFGFIVGGVDALAPHIALRIVFKCYGYVPFRLDLLLDYCTEHLLLQRIGGRYQFMHKLLQDHFAKMELD